MTGKLTSEGIWVEQYGEQGDILLLVHGLGTNGATWDPLLEIARREWPGKIIVPDLRGHGRSRRSAVYSYGGMATDLGALIAGGSSVSIIGHSLGGALAVLVATGWFGADVARVLALSVKAQWVPEEVIKAREIAKGAPRLMETREEALERYLKMSGLLGNREVMARSAEIGIADENGKFRLAADQAIFGSAALGVPALLGLAKCTLATGENDPIAPPASFAAFVLEAAVIPGAGHNVHIEQPQAIWSMFAGINSRGPV